LVDTWNRYDSSYLRRNIFHWKSIKTLSVPQKLNVYNFFRVNILVRHYPFAIRTIINVEGLFTCSLVCRFILHLQKQILWTHMKWYAHYFIPDWKTLITLLFSYEIRNLSFSSRVDCCFNNKHISNDIIIKKNVRYEQKLLSNNRTNIPNIRVQILFYKKTVMLKYIRILNIFIFKYI